jgi:hypothetical protein
MIFGVVFDAVDEFDVVDAEEPDDEAEALDVVDDSVVRVGVGILRDKRGARLGERDGIF